MNKLLLVGILALLLVVSGCVRADDIVCNYDGVCDDWETDDCIDCKDVAGRGVPIPTGDVVRPVP